MKKKCYHKLALFLLSLSLSITATVIVNLIARSLKDE